MPHLASLPLAALYFLLPSPQLLAAIKNLRHSLLVSVNTQVSTLLTEKILGKTLRWEYLGFVKVFLCYVLRKDPMLPR